jgi:hypothetical protein
MIRGLAAFLALGFVFAALPLRGAEALAPLHPAVLLVDADSAPVAKSGRPVSAMHSCGKCHDTRYIAMHSYHVSLGSDEQTAVGSIAQRRAWDYGPGSFGRWNPLTYRYLTPPGDRRLDLGVAEWVQQQGWRHVGGGPAVYGHGGNEPATAAAPAASVAGGAAGVDPNRQVIDAATGEPRVWDWQQSGVAEMNCFLCHSQHPDNAARIQELANGRFQWAVTATLAASGVVRKSTEGWTYVAEAFDGDGNVSAERLGIRSPTSLHCGQCHGLTHRGTEPVRLELTLRQWSTATKGQVFSGQRMFESAVNLADKPQWTRPWDVHAEALLECTSCHFPLNNPSHFESSPRNRPAHLAYEPRRLALNEYLRQPSHQFAKGQTAQGTAARHLAGTMRRCEDCHLADQTHDWLPYRTVHFGRLSCEACHVPHAAAPAISQVDWTLVDLQGQPQIAWRGVRGDASDPAAVVTGFAPVLLPRNDLDGGTRLVPHNLISAWYWVEGGATPRPVRQVDLKRAFLADGVYHPDLVAGLDTNRDGRLDPSELVLDTPEKTLVAQRRLEAVGVDSPRIAGEIQPFATHHGVGPAKWATRDCQTCHRADSQLGAPMLLSARVPGGVLPELVGDSGVQLKGSIVSENQTLVFRPSTASAGLYVLGHDRWPLVNWLGSLMVVGVVLGAGSHAGMRWLAYRKREGKSE